MIDEARIETARAKARQAVLSASLVLELRTPGLDDTGRHRPLIVALTLYGELERAMGYVAGMRAIDWMDSRVLDAEAALEVVLAKVEAL